MLVMEKYVYCICNTCWNTLYNVYPDILYVLMYTAAWYMYSTYFRYYAVVHPMKAKYVCTRSRAKKLTVVGKTIILNNI